MQICDARVHACTKNEIGTTSTVLDLATTCSNIILYQYDITVSVGRILSYRT